jgi:hypothetical protein
MWFSWYVLFPTLTTEVSTESRKVEGGGFYSSDSLDSGLSRRRRRPRPLWAYGQALSLTLACVLLSGVDAFWFFSSLCLPLSASQGLPAVEKEKKDPDLDLTRLALRYWEVTSFNCTGHNAKPHNFSPQSNVNCLPVPCFLEIYPIAARCGCGCWKSNTLPSLRESQLFVATVPNKAAARGLGLAPRWIDFVARTHVAPSTVPRQCSATLPVALVLGESLVSLSPPPLTCACALSRLCFHSACACACAFFTDSQPTAILSNTTCCQAFSRDL